MEPGGGRAAQRHGLAVDSYSARQSLSLAFRALLRTARNEMRFHFVMLLIVVLVSLSMHSMASAAPQPASGGSWLGTGVDTTSPRP